MVCSFVLVFIIFEMIFIFYTLYNIFLFFLGFVEDFLYILIVCDIRSFFEYWFFFGELVNILLFGGDIVVKYFF